MCIVPDAARFVRPQLHQSPSVLVRSKAAATSCAGGAVLFEANGEALGSDHHAVSGLDGIGGGLRVVKGHEGEAFGAAGELVDLDRRADDAAEAREENGQVVLSHGLRNVVHENVAVGRATAVLLLGGALVESGDE